MTKIINTLTCNYLFTSWGKKNRAVNHEHQTVLSGLEGTITKSSRLFSSSTFIKNVKRITEFVPFQNISPNRESLGKGD